MIEGSTLINKAVDAASDSGFLSYIPDIDARHVFGGARAGDRTCIDLLAREAMYLGQGITSVIHMFSPDRVIMGGRLGVPGGLGATGDRRRISDWDGPKNAFIQPRGFHCFLQPTRWFSRWFRGEGKRAPVNGERELGTNFLMDADCLFRVDVHRLHEPCRFVGSNGNQRQVK